MTAPDGLAGHLQLAGARAASRRRRPRAGRSPTTPRMSTYITALVAGPYHVGARRVRRPRRQTYPLGVFCRAVARRVPRRRRDLRGHQAGLRLLRGAVRLRRTRSPSTTSSSCRSSTPARWRTPARDLPRGLRLPVARSPTPRTSARRHDPARAGPHVVRRPRHHARGGTTCGSTSRSPSGPRTAPASTRPRCTDALDDFANQREDLGLPPGPAALDPPDRRRRCATSRTSRSTSTASPTPRAPPCSSSSWPGSARRSSSPGCGPTSSSTPGATPRWPTCSARSRRPRGRDLTELVAAVAGDRRRQHAAPGARGRRRRRVSRPSRSVQEAPALPTGITRRCARTASRSASTTCADAAAGPRRSRVELDVDGARTEVPELVGHAPPDLLLLNDDDLTYAKIRLDERSLATVDRARRRPRRLAAARAVLGRRLGHAARRASCATRDYLALVLSGIGDRDRHRRRDSRCCGQVKRGDRAVRRPGRREALPRPLGRRWRCSACAPPSRAATTSSPGPARSPRPRAPPSSSTSSTACSTARATPRRASPSTPSCAGRFAAAPRRRSGAPTRPRSTPSSQRDDTATGQRHAATARAARADRRRRRRRRGPAPWTSDDLPNALQVATIGGFVQTDQRELLRAFLDRYFAAIPDVWRHRTNETAQTVVLGLYPATLVEQARSSAPTSSSRATTSRRAHVAVNEGRDGIERSLRCQARDSRAEPTRPARDGRSGSRRCRGARCGCCGRGRPSPAARCDPADEVAGGERRRHRERHERRRCGRRGRRPPRGPVTISRPRAAGSTATTTDAVGRRPARREQRLSRLAPMVERTDPEHDAEPVAAPSASDRPREPARWSSVKPSPGRTRAAGLLVRRRRARGRGPRRPGRPTPSTSGVARSRRRPSPDDRLGSSRRRARAAR